MDTQIKTKYAYFGGGCFWCTEAVFKMVQGVVGVMPGYAGGQTKKPSYEDICTGTTGHAEIIRIEYRPDEISYDNLLNVFFASHDPTTLNRQGNDIGSQYRSVIFYSDTAEKNLAEKKIEEINNSHKDGDPVVTEVTKLTIFYEAENYHHDYFTKNPQNPYCSIVIQPKLEHVQQVAAELLKKS